MKREHVGDVEIAWDARGTGEPALLLVHGYTGSSTDFATHIDHLSQDRRLLTLDHRGHGESGHGPPQSYTFKQLTSDLIAVLEAAEAPRVDLLGHSMGGRIAMQAAIARPDLVRSLILMNTSAAAFDDPWSYVGTVTDQLRIRGMDFLDENPYLEPGDWRLSDEALRLRRTNRDVLDVEAFIGLARELSEAPPVLDEFAALDLPTTIIVGRRDSIRGASKELAKAVPSAVLNQVRGAYHFPQLSHPEQWRKLVDDHLGRLNEDSGPTS